MQRYNVSLIHANKWFIFFEEGTKRATFPVNLMKYRCIKGLKNGRCCSNISRTFPVDFPYISPYAAFRGINL